MDEQQHKPKQHQVVEDEASSSLECWPALLDPLLSTNRRVDRVLGCIYGAALGDAFGLATEFLSKKEARDIYPFDIPFPEFKRNAHNHRWEVGDWTDDTDQLLCIMDTITQCKGRVDRCVFAGKLYDWVLKGYAELGDWKGMGCGGTVGAVVRHPSFLKSPHGASKSVWKSRGKVGAANGAVMRTAVLGCHTSSMEETYRDTVEMAKVTHWDPRCVSSCVALTIAIATLISDADDDDPLCDGNDGQFTALTRNAFTWAMKAYNGAEKKRYAPEMKRYIESDGTLNDLEALELCDPEAIGYTFKCMGVGFWGMNCSFDFKTALTHVAKEGGDADTNGAVCGALWGARHGFSKLPHDWLEALKHKKWLDSKVAMWMDVIGLA